MPEPQSPANPHATPTPNRPTRRLLRRLLYSALAVTIITVGLLASAPTLVSTGWGTRLALRVVNTAIPGSLRADDLNLGWRTGQEIIGLVLTDPDGHEVIRVDRAQAPECGLTALLGLAKQNLGPITLVNPVLQVQQYPDGTTNLQRSLSAHPDAGPPTLPPSPTRETQTPSSPRSTMPADLNIQASLVGGRVTYTPTEGPPVEITIPSATLDTQGPSRIHSTLNAHVRHADQTGQVHAGFTLDRLFNAQGRLTPQDAVIEADVTVAELPVAALDRWLGHDDRFVQLLGPTLQAHIQAAGPLDRLQGTLTAKSQNFHAQLGLLSHDQQWSLAPDSTIRLHVLPKAWHTLVATANPFAPLQLREPFDIQLVLNADHLPLTTAPGHPFGLIPTTDTSCSAILAVGNVQLQSLDTSINRLSLTNVRGQLTYDGSSGAIRTTFNTQTHLDDHPPATLNLTASLHLPAGATAIPPLDNTLSHLDPATLAPELHLRLADLPVAAADLLLGTGTLLRTALGPTLHTDIDAHLADDNDQKPATPRLRVAMAARSEHLQAAINGRWTCDRFVTEPDSRATLSVSPPLIQALAQRFGPWPAPLADTTLREPAVIQLHLTECLIPLTSDSPPARPRGSANALIDVITPTGPGWPEDTALRNVRLTLTQADTTSVELNAEIHHNQETATLNATLEADPAAPGRSVFRHTAQVHDLPVSLLEPFVASEPKLSTLLGPVIQTASLQLEAPPHSPLTAQVHIESANLHSDLTGSYTTDDRTLTLRDGSRIDLTLDQTTLQALIHPQPPTDDTPPPAVQLDEPLRLSLHLAPSVIGLLPPPDANNTDEQHTATPIDPTLTRLHTRLEAQPIQLRLTDRDQPVRIDDLQVTADSDDLRQQVLLDLAARISYDDPATAPDQPDEPAHPITSRLAVSRLFDEAGHLTPDRAAIQLETSAQDLPIDVIDTSRRMQGQLTGLLGNRANLNLQARYTPHEPDDISLSIEGTTAQAQLLADIDDQTLRLRQDAQANVDITPRFSQTWLKRIHPLLDDAVSSQQPVHLTVLHQGFELPLRSSAFQEAAADALLELGTLHLREDGLINSIRRLFKRDTTQTPVATFTPLRVHLQDGVLSYRGMSMTMDNLVLNFHGQIDQVHDHVDLVMAIDGRTMAKAFDLQGVIEPGYEFQVPIRGTVDEPKLDTAAITREITRLVAQTQIRKNLRGPEGEAAGAILDLLLGGDRRPTPPDTDDQQPDHDDPNQQEPSPDPTALEPTDETPPEPPPVNPLDLLFRHINRPRGQ